METRKKLKISTNSVQETEAIAENIGAQLKGGECIELVSDLGGGKTTFTRGLVRGAGSADTVASPTFTVSRVYNTPKISIHHFDFYRLQEAGLAAHELEDLVNDPEITIVVEWGGVVNHVLPEERLTINIATHGESERHLELLYPDDLAYLVEAL